jgi:putative transposon-encoded protein
MKRIGGQNEKRFLNPSKIVVFGVESLEKKVSDSGSCGRVYLPPSWAGKRVLIIRLNQDVYNNGERDQQFEALCPEVSRRTLQRELKDMVEKRALSWRAWLALYLQLFVKPGKNNKLS